MHAQSLLYLTGCRGTNWIVGVVRGCGFMYCDGAYSQEGDDELAQWMVSDSLDLLVELFNGGRAVL